MSQTKAQLLDPQGDFTLTGQLIGVGATFSGNVSIAGTLTKQDVTNVDSVGIVTIRSGGYLDVRTGNSINTNATGGSASGTLHKNTNSGEFAIVSGGTGGNNHLSFYTSASAAPTEKLRIDSDGRLLVGINASTAADALVQSFKPTGNNSTIVVGNVATSSSGLARLDFAPSNSTVGARIECHASEDFSDGSKRTADLVFVTRKDGAQSEKLRINSSGNVSINNTNIEKRFSVKETSTSVPAGGGVYYNAAIGGSAGTAGYAVGIAFDPEGSNARYKNAIVSEATGDGYSRGKLHFLLDSANDGGEATLNESRLTILDSGKVGIGTNNPTRGPLHVHENSTGDVQIHLTNQETGTTSSDGFTIFSGGNAGPLAGFVNRETGGDIQFFTNNGSSVGVRLTISHAGVISDSKGNLRSVPLNTQASAYTLVANDAGKCILASGNVTFNNSVMSAGDMVTIINNTNGNISIVAGAGTALYNTADAATGTRTLATRGMATIYFTHNTTGYISGSGLS